MLMLIVKERKIKNPICDLCWKGFLPTFKWSFLGSLGAPVHAKTLIPYNSFFLQNLLYHLYSISFNQYLTIRLFTTVALEQSEVNTTS